MLNLFVYRSLSFISTFFCFFDLQFLAKAG